MDNTYSFKNPPVGVLADIIVAFILYKRSLGSIYKNEEGVLYRFSVFSLGFVKTGHEVPLQLVEGWLKLRKNEKANTNINAFLDLGRRCRFSRRDIICPEC